MPRLVLVYMEDNNDADRMVADLTELKVPYDPQVIGMYMVPTKFCECPEITESKARSVEGSKFGLRIHRACGLPYSYSTSGQAPKNLIREEKKGFRDWHVVFYPKRLLEAIRAGSNS